MSYPINQKVNPYIMQPSTGLNNGLNSGSGFNPAQLQDIDEEKIKKGVVNNSVLKGVSDDEEKNKFLPVILMFPVWGAMVWAMDKFNKACRGSYEKSLVGKVGNWSEKVGNNAFFQSSFMKNIEKSLSSIKSFMIGKVVPKSKILSSFVHTPTKPSNNMVLMMANGKIGAEISSNAIQLIEKGIKSGSVSLKQLGISEQELEELTKNSHTPENIKKIIGICEKQGKDASFEITKRWNPRNIPLIGKKIFKKDIYLSEIIPGMRSKTVHFSEFTNKLKAFNNGNKTWLGKSLPKSMLRVIEGLTNGTAGGKLAVLAAAYFVADAIKNTINAPKKDKISTFTENNAYNLGWYMTMPLAISIMHRFGGLKYIGMSKENVEAYRKSLKEFNQKAKENGFANKAEYNQAKKALTNMLKGDTKLALKADGAGKTIWKSLTNIVHKPLKFAARILTVGLETVRPFVPKNASGTGKFFKELLFNLKSGAGYPMRFLVFGVAISPFLAKFFAQGSHLVFGKPAKSVLDEDKEPEKEKETPQVIGIPQQEVQNQAKPVSAIQPLQQNKNLSDNQLTPMQRENLIDMYKANKDYNQVNPIQNENITSTDNLNAGYSQINPVQNDNLSNAYSTNTSYNQMNSIQNDNLLDKYKTVNTKYKQMTKNPHEPARIYIPSSEGVKIDPNQNRKQDDKVTAAFNKADIAEKIANQYVHG